MNPALLEVLALGLLRRLAEEKFDIEKRVDKIVELYRTLIEGTR